MADITGLVDCNAKIVPVPGKMFINRTYKYLSPAMKLYGEEFITKFRSLAGLSIAIQDFVLNKDSESRVFSNQLYYLIDVNGQMKYQQYLDVPKSKITFMYVLSWLRDQEYYVKDYPFDSGRNGNQHVICLKLPLDLIDNFLQGKYSKMYDINTLKKIVSEKISIKNQQVSNPLFLILSHDKEYFPEYVKQLNYYYGTNLKQSDVAHHTEFDIPPLPKNEILRW